MFLDECEWPGISNKGNTVGFRINEYRDLRYESIKKCQSCGLRPDILGFCKLTIYLAILVNQEVYSTVDL